ncbi:MAG TPA: Uma2 family endonuclease [Pyrinomonadaceae bacterium]
MAARIEPLLTVADLDSCPDDNNRYELIDGELFVSRAPGIPHQRVLLNLEVALSNYLSGHPVGILVPGAGAIFSNHDAVIPDLVFVRNERWPEVVSNNKFTAGLDLVIEILSPGKENRERDLLVKRQLYEKFGIGEYWVVDSENRSVKVYKLDAARLQSVATFRDSEEITTDLLPGFRLTVSALFNL